LTESGLLCHWAADGGLVGRVYDTKVSRPAAQIPSGSQFVSYGSAALTGPPAQYKLRSKHGLGSIGAVYRDVVPGEPVARTTLTPVQMQRLSAIATLPLHQ